jgi:hypothetical protein
MGDIAIDRQHDRRLVVRIHQLRSGDADHPAMPPFAADDEHVVGADRGIRFDRFPGIVHQFRFLLLAAEILLIQLLREEARFVFERLIRREQKAGGDIRTAHAPGGIDARGEHERHLIAVDVLADQAAAVEQSAQTDRVWSGAQ